MQQRHAMAARTEKIGFSHPFKERRGGKDRRKYVDPRYRNFLYPAFVDRRKGERRKPVYEQLYPLVQEHPIRKWIVVIGLLAAVFLTYLFFFTNFTVVRKSWEERGRTQPITIGYDIDGETAVPWDLSICLRIAPLHKGRAKGRVKRLDKRAAVG